MTALDIIRRALRKIGAVAAEEEPSASEAQHALEELNAMAAAWEGKGIRWNWQKLTLHSDIPLPDWQIDALMWNLAVMMAPEWGATPSPVVVAAAAEGLQNLKAAYAAPQPAQIDPALVRWQSAGRVYGWRY